MQIIEMYTGDDNKTYLRDYTPEELAKMADRIVGPLHLPVPNSSPNRPGGFYVDFHASPSSPSSSDATMMLLMCTGVSEYQTENGWRRLVPGDVLLASDLSGKGHGFNITSLESRIALVVAVNPA